MYFHINWISISTGFPYIPLYCSHSFSFDVHINWIDPATTKRPRDVANAKVSARQHRGVAWIRQAWD